MLTVGSCDFADLFKDLVFINPRSASDTLIFFGTLIKNGQRVVLKISLIPKDPMLDNSLIIEQDIYTNTVNRLLKTRTTPHLIPMIGSFVCNNFEEVLKNTDFKNKIKAIEHLNSIYQYKLVNGLRNVDFYYRNIANIMILEMNNGFELSDKLYGLQIPEIDSITFQILYTLACFHKVGLLHNDLHTSNILIEKSESVPKYIDYIVSKTEIYRVPTYGILVKIYDFDYAFNGKENTKFRDTRFENQKDFGCLSNDFCTFNPLYDTWFFLSSLVMLFNRYDKRYDTNIYTGFIQKIINTVTNEKFREYFTKERHNAQYPHFCNIKPGSKYCDDNSYGVNEIQTPDKLLKLLFSDFKIPFDKKILSKAYFLDDRVRKDFGMRVSKIKERPVLNRQFNTGACEVCQFQEGGDPDIVLKAFAKAKEDIDTYLTHYKTNYKTKLDLRTLLKILTHIQYFILSVEPEFYIMVITVVISIYIPDFKKLINIEDDYNEFYKVLIEYDCTSVYDFIFFCDKFKAYSSIIRRNSKKIEDLIKIAITSREGVIMDPEKCAKVILQKALKIDLGEKDTVFNSTFKLGDEYFGYVNLNKPVL